MVRTIVACCGVLGLLLSPPLRAQNAPPSHSEEPATPRNSEELKEEIVVTATRTPTRISETSGSTVVVSRRDIERSAAPTLDDTLRSVPGFTLFRRSGSRTANPTSQGVSLRGIGASGASRALVLDDGVPLNDPFGGWVYWNRVPLVAIDHVEVVRGGASELYGSGSMGGVIQLVRRPDASSVVASASTGSLGTHDASLFAAASLPAQLTMAASGLLLETDGYVPVAAAQRGAVDVETNSSTRSGEWSLARNDEESRYFIRASRLLDSRVNGTRLQINDTMSNLFSGGADLRVIGGSASARLWLGEQRYHQTFSSIAAGRAAETLTRDQRVESDARGASAQWFGAFGSATVVAGADHRDVSADNREIVSATGALQEGGGEQRNDGAFAELLLDRGRLHATLGGRFDAWRNRDERTAETRSSDAFSPRLSLRWTLDSAWSLNASGYEAFRAPTLNELYRSFRVGNVQTEANAALDAERMRGYELGVVRRSAGGSMLRANVFDMTLRDPIANVTLRSTPQLVTRQRQNLGRTRTRGLELDVDQRVGDLTSIEFSYLLSRSEVLEFGDSAVVGKRLPQTPSQQASATVSHQRERWSSSLALRWVGNQFEDDRNEIELDQWTSVDLFTALRLCGRADVFVAVENLLDERYEIGRAGVTTLGAPRTSRIGLRFRAR